MDAEEATALRVARRAMRAAARDRLRERVGELIGAINKPLAAVIRDHALRYLPPASLLRFRAVHPSWASLISSPIFAHSQSRAHLSRPSGLFLVRHASPPPPTGPPAPPSLLVPFEPPLAHALPDPALSFLPSPAAVRCSANGLVCAVAVAVPSPSPSRGYYVCNPATARWARIPAPPRDPGPDPALALVFDPAPYNFRCDYALVCAFEAGGEGSGVYGFQTFSSAAGGWWVSGRAPAPAEGLVASSGAAARGGAYWRTAIGTVVGYEPGADRVRVLSCPPEAAWEGEEWWELGAAGGALSCVAATEEAVVAYRLGEGDEWAEAGRIPVRVGRRGRRGRGSGSGGSAGMVFRERPRPLRTHGEDMEVVAWAAGEVVAVDVATRRVRVIASAGAGAGAGAGPMPMPQRGETEYVAHINTLAAVLPMKQLDREPPLIEEERGGGGQ